MSLWFSDTKDPGARPFGYNPWRQLCSPRFNESRTRRCTCNSAAHTSVLYIVPHSWLRRYFPPILGRMSFTLSVATPLCPYGIAWRRVYGLSTSGLFKTSLCNPPCGTNHLARRTSHSVQQLSRCSFRSELPLNLGNSIFLSVFFNENHYTNALGRNYAVFFADSERKIRFLR